MARYWQLLVKAQGETKSAEHAMKRLQRQTRKFGDNMKGLGQSMTMGLTLPLTGFAVLGLKGLADAERASAQTRAAIESTGNAANTSVKGIESMAMSLRRLSGVDDEIIQQGANVLLTFTNIENAGGKAGGVFDQATEAALNMSVALGTDMKSASMLVGKALNDPIRGMTALRRSGVQLTKQQENQVKQMMSVGDVAGAQAVLLKELETQFGGSAEAAGDTFAGQMSRAKLAVEEMAEAVMQHAIPFIERLAVKVEGLATKFGSMTPVQQKFALGFGVVVAAIGPVLIVLGTLVSAFASLLPVLKALRVAFVLQKAVLIGAKVALLAYRGAVIAATVATKLLSVAMRLNPIGLIITGIILAGVALVKLYQRSDTFRKMLGKLVDAFKRFGKASVAAFREGWRRAQPLVNLLKAIGRLYIQSIIVRFQLLRTVAIAVWNALRSAWSKAAGIFNAMRNSMNFGAAFDAIRNGFKQAIDYIRDKWNSLKFRVPSIKVAGKTLFEGRSIGVPALARGGNIRTPGMALVGEAGPELLQLPRGARVTPLDRAGGGNTYNVTVNAQQPVDTVAFMRSLRTAAQMGTI